LIVLIIVILPTLHFLVEDEYLTLNNFMGGGNPPFFWTEVVVQFVVTVRRRCNRTPEGRGRLKEKCRLLN
jgi:hypothetical protein